MTLDRKHVALLVGGLVLIRLLLWSERNYGRQAGDRLVAWTGDPITRLFLVPVLGVVLGVAFLLIRLSQTKE